MAPHTPTPPSADQPPRARNAGRVLVLTAGNVVALGIFLLLDIALARLLPQATFGTYKQVRLFHNVVGPLFSVALPYSVLYFLPRYKDRERLFISQTAALLALLGGLMAVAAYGLAPLIARLFENPALAAPLRIFSLYALLDIWMAFVPPALIALNRTRRAAVYLMVRAALNILLVLSLAWLHLSVEAAVTGMVLAAALSAGLGLFLVRRWLHLDALLRVRWATVRRQLHYALPLGMAGNIGRWAYQVDQIVVSLLFTPAGYAVYVVGAIEVPLVTQLQNSIGQVLLPVLSRLLEAGEVGKAAAQWRRAMLRTALVMFPLFCLLEFVADDALVLLFSDKYAPSVPLFRIYLCLVPLRIATFGLFLRAAGRTQYDLVGVTLYLLVNAVLSPALALWLGLVGPPLATVLATVWLAAYYLYATGRQLALSPLDLLPLRPLAQRFLIALLPYGALWPLAPFAGTWPLLVRLGVNGGLYTGVYLLLLRLFLREDFHYLCRLGFTYLQKLLPSKRWTRKRA